MARSRYQAMVSPRKLRTPARSSGGGAAARCAGARGVAAALGWVAAACAPGAADASAAGRAEPPGGPPRMAAAVALAWMGDRGGFSAAAAHPQRIAPALAQTLAVRASTSAAAPARRADAAALVFALVGLRSGCIGY